MAADDRVQVQPLEESKRRNTRLCTARGGVNPFASEAPVHPCRSPVVRVAARARTRRRLAPSPRRPRGGRRRGARRARCATPRPPHAPSCSTIGRRSVRARGRIARAPLGTSAASARRAARSRPASTRASYGPSTIVATHAPAPGGWSADTTSAMHQPASFVGAPATRTSLTIPPANAKCTRGAPLGRHAWSAAL